MELSIPLAAVLVLILSVQIHGLSPELYSESEVVDIVEDHVSKRSPGERKFSFKVFGEDIEVNLKKSEAFHPETLPVHYLDADEDGNVIVEDYTFRTTGKDLYGDVKTGASVIIDETDGNTKIMGNMLGNFVIEPIKDEDNKDTGIIPPMRKPIKHRVYRTNVTSLYDLGNDYLPVENDRDQSELKESMEKRGIPSKIYVNIHATVDPSHYRKILQQDPSQDVASYIRILYHSVQVAHFSTIAYPTMESSLHGVTICKSDAGCNELNLSAGKWSYGVYKYPSSNLRKWTYSQRYRTGTDYDLMFFTTANKICTTPSNCNVGGYCASPGVCLPFDDRTKETRRLGIMMDNGVYDSVKGIGHEVGHGLNMPHDGDNNFPYARACQGGTSKGDYIMGQTKFSLHNWRYSSCSMHYLHEFLQKPESSCIKTPPSRNEFAGWADWAIAGTYRGLDNQCKAIWGNDHSSCQSTSYKNDQICLKIGCKRGANGYCGLASAPADGSPCGPNYVCMKGYCVKKPW